MTITPEQAATLAANYVEPHEMPDCPDAVELWESSYDLAQTIAGMEWEYGLRQPRPEPHAEGELYTSWGYRLFAAKAAFAGLTDRGVECYIVRRLVGPVEEVTE